MKPMKQTAPAAVKNPGLDYRTLDDDTIYTLTKLPPSAPRPL